MKLESLGKIQDVVAGNNASAGNIKKSFGGHQKKKENEASMVYSRKGKGRYQDTDHHITVVTILVTAPQQHTYTPMQGYWQRPKQPPRKFDTFPMPYAELLPQLLESKLVEKRKM